MKAGNRHEKYYEWKAKIYEWTNVSNFFVDEYLLHKKVVHGMTMMIMTLFNNGWENC